MTNTFNEDFTMDDEKSSLPEFHLKRTNEEQVKYSTLLVQLVKGVIYADKDKDKDSWTTLLTQEMNVRNYFKEIGLALVIDKQENYAFLRQLESDDGMEIPSLIIRRRLSADQTLLLLHLRQRLQEHDIDSIESRLIIERDIMHEWLQPYFPERNNEIAQEKQFNGLIKRCIELGFLRKLNASEHEFEVMNIIKSFVDINFVTEQIEAIRDFKGLSDETPQEESDDNAEY